jgi:hypothetical protein
MSQASEVNLPLKVTASLIIPDIHNENVSSWRPKEMAMLCPSVSSFYCNLHSLRSDSCFCPNYKCFTHPVALFFLYITRTPNIFIAPFDV